MAVVAGDRTERLLKGRKLRVIVAAHGLDIRAGDKPSIASSGWGNYML